MQSVEGDLLIWAYPQDVILYARSSYYLNNMFIIYLFSDIFRFYKLFWSLIQKKCRNVCHYVSFRDVTSSCFPSMVPCIKFTLSNVAVKQVTDVNLILKDSDMDSESLSSLIRLSVLDGKKTDSSKGVSFIGI